MDSASTQQGQMLPPSRRTYKRLSPKQWEDKKDLIRELFIEQDRTHEDVVRILKESYDFDVGERQLKRKTVVWGFTKNISSSEMWKMVGKRKRRQDELERATKFMRRHGDGEFEEVAQEKLDKFQKRFGLSNDLSSSPSSGMPSNIMYHTPSSANQNIYSDDPRPRSDADQTTREFNDSVELIFENIERNGSSHQANSASSLVKGPNARLSGLTPWDLGNLGYDYMCDGNYGAAGQVFELSSLRFTELNGPNHWQVVTFEFRAALMKVADFPGCPQSIIARFVQELSRFLVRERHKYNLTVPRKESLLNLRKLLTGLKMSTGWAAQMITQQRALQIWVPILGPEHPKMKMMQNNIAAMKNRRKVNLDKELWHLEGAENIVPEIFELNSNQHLRSIGSFLHLSGGSPNELLHKFRSLENSDILSRQFQREFQLLRYGRSRSLLGFYYSFIQQFDNAEKAFRDSNQYMQYEACVEIKLHRILWYAEHKTRVRDEEGVGILISQAHEIFMENESTSEFIINHFPDRFNYLCMAASRRVPIDDVLNETLDDGAFERHRSGSLPASFRIANRPHSALPSPIPSPERLFPLTPRGLNSTIDVETWRQFVNFSPTIDTLQRERSQGRA